MKNALKLTISIEGKTGSDLEIALEEVLKSVRAHSVFGYEHRPTSEYYFDVKSKNAKAIDRYMEGT